jgi:hypothetical protein
LIYSVLFQKGGFLGSTSDDPPPLFSHSKNV